MGVKVSRKITELVPAKSVFASNQYSDFLTNATAQIGERAGRLPLIESSQEAQHSGMKRLHGAPVTDSDYFLGLQKRVKIKLDQTSGDTTKYENIWSTLVDKDGTKIKVYLEEIRSNDVAIVAGEIPTYFFPETISFGSTVQPSSEEASFLMYLQTEVLNIIRGGVFISGAGKYVSLARLPGMLSVNSSGYPDVGDIIELGGDTRKIIRLSQHNNHFLAELDQQLRPYQSSNTNLVRIHKKNRFIPKTDLAINKLTDSEFFMGVQRKRDVLVLDDSLSGVARGLLTEENNFYYPYKATRFKDGVVKLSIDLKEAINFNCHPNLGSKSMHARLNRDEVELAIDTPDCKSKTRSLRLGSIGQALLNNGLHSYSSSHADTNGPGVVGNTKPNLSPLGFSCNCGSDSIWEIYPGSMLNFYYGSVNPSSTQMMIHALGEKLSHEYYTEFKRLSPRYVALAKPRQFMPWLLNWHWTFFEELVQRYDLSYENEDFSLWVRNCNNADEVNSSTGEIKLPNPGHLIVNDTLETKLYTVELDYTIRTKSWLSMLPVLGNSNRYYCKFDNGVFSWARALPASLSPFQKKAKLPLVLKANESVTINCYEESPFSIMSDFTINSVTLKTLATNFDNILSLFYANRLLKAEYLEGR
jgi:hypothetical protein